MKFYRYEADAFGSFSQLRLLEYRLVKETPKGYWIGHQHGWWGKERWVSKSAKKRYAYPTEEEALSNFRHRKRRQIFLLEAQLQNAKKAIVMAGGEVPVAKLTFHDDNFEY